MKLYTKTGDEGSTSLLGGQRVKKCDSRVAAYGDVDELISYLGVARAHAEALQDVGLYCDDLLQIQQHLFEVSSHLACEGECSWLKPLDIESKLAFLEQKIDGLTELLPAKFSFVIPGPPALSAELHVARTICRRCERSAVAIEGRNTSDVDCTKYLNRLSDYLFALAQVVALQ